MKSKIRLAVIVAVMVVVVAGCDSLSPNYSGNGNEFNVIGVVTDTGDQSIAAEVIHIEVSNGKADGWWDEGSHRFHDNCDCDGGFVQSRTTVGVVYNENGNEISPSRVAIGDCVNFVGTIRADNEGKSHNYRPVFETATVVDC